MKEIIKATVGMYFKQPIHKTLKELKVIHIISLYVLYEWCDILITHSIKLTKQEASLEMVGLYLVQFAALVPMFIKAVHDIRRPYYDEQTKRDNPSD